MQWGKGKNAKKYRKNVEYGSARWGTAEDIKPYVDPTFENNVILTQTERLTMNNRPKDPKTARNKNVLVVGGSGSGKTRFFIKPNLMQLSRLATHYARGENYDVLVRPGRLKSVMMEKVYQQQRSRDTFVPQDQYQAIFVDEYGTKYINNRVSKYDTRAMAENDVLLRIAMYLVLSLALEMLLL